MVLSSICNPDSKLILLGYLLVLDLILTDFQKKKKKKKKKIFRCSDNSDALTSHGLNCIQIQKVDSDK